MKKIIVANQKMNLSYDDAKSLKKQMDELCFDNVDFIVSPSFINLNVFKENYKICAQNCHHMKQGPYTGEISAYHLKLIGCSHTLIGHASRREFETNKLIKCKVKAALDTALIPILCIGETAMEKQLNKTAEVLKKQITIPLGDLSEEEINEVLISYEPVWSIGKGEALSANIIKDTIEFIKQTIRGFSPASKYKVIYGGSVDSSTINEILKIDNVDGVLIGGAAVDIVKLSKLIKVIK